MTISFLCCLNIRMYQDNSEYVVIVVSFIVKTEWRVKRKTPTI